MIAVLSERNEEANPVLFFCVAVVGLRAGGLTVTATILTTGLIKEGNDAGYPGF
jgi:hypothetical protein